ncbi:hypothetical protein JCM9140_511 [Halalkalibacter wakoensis JCM 9140]|uniref:STAS domain-containing protein n=1 Tax=Halalkalibacter wakoensis JCM 9140 TaxID=1236970 RepID=W4PXV8_9BACI|nr:STAS domain-containing protein [Halalkalibacter wakoensis]GAE24572.1 hypothetical protein JCM9140_511 [Halalkalibacter wakoensis JCM 9140]
MDKCKITKDSDGAIYVKLPEKILIDTSTLLKESLFPHIEREVSRITFDFSNVEIINSSGIGVLLVIQKRANLFGVKIKMDKVNSHIIELLQRTKLKDVI